jgi:hypothetical protein
MNFLKNVRPWLVNRNEQLKDRTKKIWQQPQDMFDSGQTYHRFYGVLFIILSNKKIT